MSEADDFSDRPVSRLAAIAAATIGRTVGLHPDGRHAVVVQVTPAGLTVRSCGTGETSAAILPDGIHHWCDASTFACPHLARPATSQGSRHLAMQAFSALPLAEDRPDLMGEPAVPTPPWSTSTRRQPLGGFW